MLDLAMAHLPADCILVYSTDPWGTLEHPRKVEQAHTQVGIKIQQKKPKIFQSEVEYLRRKGIDRLCKVVEQRTQSCGKLL